MSNLSRTAFLAKAPTFVENTGVSRTLSFTPELPVAAPTLALSHSFNPSGRIDPAGFRVSNSLTRNEDPQHIDACALSQVRLGLLSRPHPRTRALRHRPAVCNCADRSCGARFRIPRLLSQDCRGHPPQHVLKRLHGARKVHCIESINPLGVTARMGISRLGKA